MSGKVSKIYECQSLPHFLFLATGIPRYYHPEDTRGSSVRSPVGDKLRSLTNEIEGLKETNERLEAEESSRGYTSPTRRGNAAFDPRLDLDASRVYSPVDAKLLTRSFNRSQMLC